MADWREAILSEFTPEVARLTIAFDPDGLLLEQNLLDRVLQRGFEVVQLEDEVQFRFVYESRFRARWDRGEMAEMIVDVRGSGQASAALPYDILSKGRTVELSLAGLFPQLSCPVVASLDRADFDALYQAVVQFRPDPLGENATKDFVLRHVFEIAPELIKTPVELLRVLLRRHYRTQRIPDLVERRLIEVLRTRPAFKDWPLERIVPDRNEFLRFPQERWPHYLSSFLSGVAEHPLMEIPGPVALPFDHEDIRVYVDNYFVEGLLQPVEHEAGDRLLDRWVAVGLRGHRGQGDPRRVRRLIELANESVPTEGCPFQDWCRFAWRWAELEVGLYRLSARPGGTAAFADEVSGLQAAVDEAFSSWLARHYAALANLPPVPPAMVHHVPRLLARKLASSPKAKVALVVVDGMSWTQWLVIRDLLSESHERFDLREDATLAWLPTLTSVSRQALFAGLPPLYFPDSIDGTEKEPALWTKFWSDHGLAAHQVAYRKGLGKGDPEQTLDLLTDPRIRVVGLVVDTLDRILHGAELGARGVLGQVEHWARDGYLGKLLRLLLVHGFRPVVTSDHGNVEATGCGRPGEGALAELRGERVRVYSDPALRARVSERFPQARLPALAALPDSYYPLVAPLRRAFVQEGECIVAHGGDALEELIVPLVTVRGRKA